MPHFFNCRRNLVVNLKTQSTAVPINFQRVHDVSVEETTLDMIINDMENLNFEKATEKVKELLQHNRKHLYALMIEAYIELISTNIANLYPYLTKITEICPYNVEVWALLYALYKKNAYRAGHQHSKMMLEKNAGTKMSWLPFFCTRKEPYFQWDFEANTTISCIFVFLKLGTYEFARIVYDVVKERLKEIDRIMISSTIDLLTRQYERGLQNLVNYKKNPNNEMIIRLYTGHFLYAMGRHEDGVHEYQVVFHSPLSKLSCQVAWLRCGFWDLRKHKYETAKTYFSACTKTMGTFLSWYGLGICFFRTQKYEEAELCFSRASGLYRTFPDLWIYLTLLNLKKGSKDQAYKCFATAKKYYVKSSELWEEMVTTFYEENLPLAVTL